MHTDDDLTLIDWVKVFAIAGLALAGAYGLFYATTLVMMAVMG